MPGKCLGHLISVEPVNGDRVIIDDSSGGLTVQRDDHPRRTHSNYFIGFVLVQNGKAEYVFPLPSVPT